MQIVKESKGNLCLCLVDSFLVLKMLLARVGKPVHFPLSGATFIIKKELVVDVD